MKAESQFFNDGWCDILDKEEGLPLRCGVPYEDRTVGSKRFFEAEQAGHTVTRMIRIPLPGVALNCCEVGICGQVYQIAQVQEMKTCPKCLQMTLEQSGIAWAAQRGE